MITDRVSIHNAVRENRQVSEPCSASSIALGIRSPIEYAFFFRLAFGCDLKGGYLGIGRFARYCFQSQKSFSMADNCKENAW